MYKHIAICRKCDYYSNGKAYDGNEYCELGWDVGDALQLQGDGSYKQVEATEEEPVLSNTWDDTAGNDWKPPIECPNLLDLMMLDQK